MTSSFSEELKQHNSEKGPNSQCVVVLLGQYDEFSAMGVGIQSLILQIAKTHCVAMRMIGDASNFGKSIRDACSSLGRKASMLIVISHGRSDCLRLEEDVPWYQLGWMRRPLYTKENICPEDFSMISLNGKIILLSCMSGKEIAQNISDASRRVVFAPMGFITDVGICLQKGSDKEITLLSYNEKNEQNMEIFTPGRSSSTLSSTADMLSDENKESFVALADYLRKKAEEGNTDAQLKLGGFYLCGKGGCAKSERDAIKWTSLAASHGNARAQYVMGCCYLSGQLGVEKSERQAIEWFQRSASQEFAPALFQMGVFYYNGRCGFAQSDAEAFNFFVLAAKNKMPQADYYLGIMFEYGRGTYRSLKHAKEHYKLAEENEISEAKFRLANLLFQEEQQSLENNYLLNRLYLFAMELLEQTISKIEIIGWNFLKIRQS